MGVGAGLAIAGAATGIIGGIMGSNAQKAAAREAAQAQREANLLNYALQIQSRGGDASAILKKLGFPTMGGGENAILPMYAPPGTEKELFKSALASSKAISSVPPEQQMAAYQDQINQMMPAVLGGDTLVRSIYDKTLDQERLAALNPVLNARLQQAEANKQAIALGLADAQNRMAAEEARKGFVGSGSYGRNRMLESTVWATQQAAQQKAAAELQNAMDKRALDENNLQLRLASLSTPFQRAGQKINLQMAPQQGVAQLAVSAQEPLKFFRLGTANPPDMRAPTLMPTSDPGAVALAGVGQALGNLGGMYANQQAATNLSNQNRMMAAGQMPSNYGTLTPQQQTDYASMWSRAQGVNGSLYE